MQFKTLAARLTGLAVYTSLVIALGGCGITYTAKTSEFAAAPVSITSFTASASTVFPGQSVTLSWSVSNATSVSIDNGIGTVSGSSVKVTPATTTTYTLTATGATGSASRTATVRVFAPATDGPAAIASFTALPGLLSPLTTGVKSTTLQWVVTGAASLSIDNGIGLVTGNSIVVSPAATTTYTLTAMDAAGNPVSASTTVKVRSSLGVLSGTPYAGTDRTNYLISEGLCEYPYQLAMDAAGNVYATDKEDQAVCRITPAGNVSVLASDVAGGLGSSARKGTRLRWDAGLTSPKRNAGTRGALSPVAAVNAGLVTPTGIAVTPDGSTVYVSDADAGTIRKISVGSDGTATVSTVAGGGVGYLDGPGPSAQFNQPMGLALDASGNLYVADSGNYVVREIAFGSDGSATVATLAGNTQYGYQDGAASQAEFGAPMGLAVSADGMSLYVSDVIGSPNATTGLTVYQSVIRKITANANTGARVSTVAGSQYGFADGTGTAAQFSQIIQLALSSDGTTLYVSDPQNCVLRKIALAADGTAAVSTVAGTPGKGVHWDGTGANASFDGPGGITLDAHGNAYVAEMWSDYFGLSYGNGGPMTLRKVALATGQVSTLVVNAFGNTGGQSDGAGANASFMLPSGLVGDASGNYYVADTINSTIRKIAMKQDGTATITTLAGTAGVYGNADGLGSAAQFDAPVGMALAPGGQTLYIADWSNGTVRRLDLASGAVTTLAGTPGTHGYGVGNGQFTLYFPRRLAVDSTGLIYVVDEALNGDLRTVDPKTGAVSDFAPVDATGGLFAQSVPTGIAYYASADKTRSVLYISAECAIFQVDLTAATRTVSLVAGSGTCGYQDGPAGTSLFSEIWDIAADSQGNVYVADTENSVIRRIGTSGTVSTLVGTYGNTLTTQGTLPGSIYLPLGLAIDPSDNLLVTVPNAVLTLAP